MRITFLTPPVLVGDRATERVAGCTYTLYPVPNIYELTIAALIEREGFDVRYKECVLEEINRAQFEQWLADDDSDVYALYTVNLGLENDLVAHEIIRRYRGGQVAIVFEGPAPTQFPERFLLDERSFAVRGEPDYTMRDLMHHLDESKPLDDVLGLSYRAADEMRHNGMRPLIKNLDELPFPARHLIPEKIRYNFSNPKLGVSPYTAVATSRNCPNQCIYCVPSSITFARELEFKKNFQHKPPISMRSVEHVRQELEMLKAEGYKSFSFQDDNWIWNDKRTLEMSEMIGKLGMAWGCQSRADRVTEERIKAMAEAGCKYIDIGVESFNQDILDYVKKDLTVEDQIRAITLMKKYGMHTKINVLLGTSPLETVETIRANEKVIKDLDVDQVMFSITSPFPGTEFYDLAKENGWFVNGDYEPVDVQKEAITSFPNLSKATLESEVRRANRRFFLSPRFIRKNLHRFKSFRDLKAASKALYRKLWA
ncbi:MAG TPA: radical SAM protein [bacterium]|nr:radical SAM protein [bacterium]